MKAWQVALSCLAVAAVAVLGTLLFVRQTEDVAPQQDIPRYTADQVIAVAKAYAGECGHGGDYWSRYDPDGPGPVGEPIPASWTTVYLGDGEWRVAKKCGSVEEWTFYEATGELR